MADRETLINALIELECKPTTYARELLRKNWVEALTTAEFDPCRRLDGRSASRELWEYEESIAEIRREKESRMRKFMMKHEVRNDGKPVRKEKRKAYIKEKHYGSFDPYRGLITVKKYRQIIAEKYDDRDYALEQEEIEDSLMWERINFDVETERLKALEVWLEWA